MSNYTTKDIPQKSAGVTLIELMVTVGIFIVISGVTLANYPLFSSTIVLENVAQEIALSIRQAQVFGISVRVQEQTQTHGVYFYTNEVPGATEGNREFFLFADVVNANRLMDTEDGSLNPIACTPGEGECVDRINIRGNQRIVLLCQGLKSAGAPSVNTEQELIDEIISHQTYGELCNNNTLHISFTRPDPNAHIQNPDVGTESDAEIFIASPRGAVRTIVVRQTGQIEVE